MDGFSALQLVEQREYLPDLILLDVMMPGTSGYVIQSGFFPASCLDPHKKTF